MKNRQPVCDPCWVLETADWEYDDDGVPLIISYSIPSITPGFPLEVCCVCGCHTIAGIYMLKNVKEVPFPTIIPED